jgi:hypothetical protein
MGELDQSQFGSHVHRPFIKEIIPSVRRRLNISARQPARSKPAKRILVIKVEIIEGWIRAINDNSPNSLDYQNNGQNNQEFLTDPSPQCEVVPTSASVRPEPAC